jgi:hypothetical protein
VEGDYLISHGPVQAKAAGATAEIDLQTPSGGARLPQPVQAKMEQAFAADFSGVRVHVDGQADALGAHAFAHGNDLHFAAGTYDPGSPAGQALIGHELAHVVQQRDGRVSGGGAGTTVVQDPALEAEADALGAAAAAREVAGDDEPATGGGSTTPAGAIQGHGIVQALGPVLGIGTAAGAFAAMSAGDAAGVVGTLVGLGSATASATSAVMPGQSGVQEIQLAQRMSSTDQRKLRKLVQMRLINAFVEHYRRAHPMEPVGTTTTVTTTTTGRPRRTEGGATETTTITETSTSGAGDAIDTQLRQAVVEDVEQQVAADLNASQHIHSYPEAIWCDDGTHERASVGTVGAIQLADVRTAGLVETAALRGEAANLVELQNIPFLGETLDVRQVRGGVLRQGLSWSLGWNDSLAINVAGGAESFNEAENDGHGRVTVDTTWHWDDGVTRASLAFDLLPGGQPGSYSALYTGDPDDWSIW